jgi:hypothetical protein
MEINKCSKLIKLFTPQLAIIFSYQNLSHRVMFLGAASIFTTQCASNFKFFSLRNPNTKLHISFRSQRKLYRTEMF